MYYFAVHVVYVCLYVHDIKIDHLTNRPRTKTEQKQFVCGVNFYLSSLFLCFHVSVFVNERKSCPHKNNKIECARAHRHLHIHSSSVETVRCARADNGINGCDVFSWLCFQLCMSAL